MTNAPARVRPVSATLWTVGSSAVVLALHLVTGILTARLLLASGRGELGAIQSWMMAAAVIGAFGYGEASSWFVAQRRFRDDEVLSTTAMVTAVSATTTIAVAVALVPFGFRAQSASAVELARWASVWILPLMMVNTAERMLSGRAAFAHLALIRVAAPLLALIGLVGIALGGRMSVGAALGVQIGSFAFAATIAAVVLVMLSGWARPRLRVAGEGLSYGLRAYGNTLGALITTRLDLIMLPVFVLASQIGLYVVAVSAASVVMPLFGQLGQVVFPIAAGASATDAIPIVIRATRLVLLAAGTTALALGLVASLALGLVYGPEFAAAATPMRVLLPGLVCWAAAGIAASGLKAIGLPGRASIGQVVGIAVTVPGLLIAIPRWGILGAAVVSSVAYGLVFAVDVSFLRARGASLHQLIDLRAAAADLVAVLRRAAIERAARTR